MMMVKMIAMTIHMIIHMLQMTMVQMTMDQ